jgi:predicted TIM-barrel fold metal-dependent hydrolase
MINGNAHGSFLDDKAYWPIFECAAALGVPIYMHPSGTHPDVANIFYQGFPELARPAWGFAQQASVHFLRLMFAGVFDAYPTLKIILGHLGEGLPFGIERLDHHTRKPAARRGLKRTPIEYFRDNLAVTTSGNFSVAAFLCTLMTLGIDNILFSIDWPYESNDDGTRFLRDLPISDQDKRKLAHRNAEQLLRLA